MVRPIIQLSVCTACLSMMLPGWVSAESGSCQSQVDQIASTATDCSNRQPNTKNNTENTSDLSEQIDPQTDSNPRTVEPMPLRAARKGQLRVVEQVDLDRYMGLWYEIARYPNYYQDGLVGVTVYYELKDGKNISVINTGYKQRIGGEKSSSEPDAWVANDGCNAKWDVQFFWPFTADYWIIDLANDYSYAVVGQPSRDYLWILSRTPQLDRATLEGIKSRLRQQGYDPDKLEMTPQPKLEVDQCPLATASVSKP
jgi:apolipoprotein D and lipocalin family protein